MYDFFLIFARNCILMMKTYMSMLYVSLMGVVLLCGCSHGESEPSPPSGPDTVAVIVQQVQQCSRLYTTEYHVHKVVTATDRTTLNIGNGLEFDVPGYRKMIMPIDATLKGYIDFSGFSQDNIEIQGHRITVTLPDPEVTLTSSRVDYDNMKEYVSSYRSRFSSDEKNALMAQGREDIVASIPSLGIEQSARVNAVRLLVPIISAMGFNPRDITITFRRDFSADQLVRQLD